MRVQWLFMVWISLVCAGACASQPGCYRTAEAAAAQTGVRGVDGFRLEARRRDVFSGAVWATVKSCAHPERPGVLVMAAWGDLGPPRVIAEGEKPGLVLVAGARVTIVERDEAIRIEMPGVAQGSGVVGDWVRVRLLTLSEDGGERFVDGIVRASGVVEVAAR